MGLNAVVYRGLANPGLDRNENTSDVLEQPVIHKRLGNASFIGEVANEVTRFTGKDSILFRRIVYSGSHSGDAVSTDELDRLESEINEIEGKTRSRTAELDTFLKDIRELIITAREQNNPILFL